MRPVEVRRRPQQACTPRMQALARLPVFFDLDGKRAVVAGNGAAVAWKAELLSAAGADVEVFACGIGHGGSRTLTAPRLRSAASRMRQLPNVSPPRRGRPAFLST